MPYRSGGKWKWGNISRKSKEDLRKTVYGIWLKQGKKGSFSKFWKTGKISEAEVGQIEFAVVPKASLLMLLNDIKGWCENKRWSDLQFTKFLSSEKAIDSDESSAYYGVFVDGRCAALSYLNKTPKGCILIAEVQSAVKGFGRILIEDILSRGSAVWLKANPEGGEKLLEYYRSFELEEAEAESQHFFLKAEGKKRDEILKAISVIAVKFKGT